MSVSSAPATAGTPTSAQVTNQAAFTNGGATNHFDPAAGKPVKADYACYTSDWTKYPPQTAWVNFNDMYTANAPLMTSGCPGVTGNTEAQSQAVHDAILQVSEKASVDPRLTLAVVMQEVRVLVLESFCREHPLTSTQSKGCVNVGTTANGVTNPGIMQTHAGTSFVGNSASAEEQTASITQMVRDGVQGTSTGDGLVQLLNQYGDIYEVRLPWFRPFCPLYTYFFALGRCTD